MNNAEKFQKVFGYYATEMWAKPESEFLEWINSEYVPTNEVSEKQVASKLKNADDSLLTEKSEACKEQKSKLESEKESVEDDLFNKSFWRMCMNDTNVIPRTMADTSVNDDVEESATPTDLISRQAAIEAIEKAYCNPCKERGDDYNEVRCRACNFDDAINQIDALPPVEPQRPKGEWIEYIDDRNGRRYVKCSSCNKSTLNAVEYDVLDGERHIMDYCPNCGVKMESEE